MVEPACAIIKTTLFSWCLVDRAIKEHFSQLLLYSLLEYSLLHGYT